jgi:hypothetical protein
MLSYRWSPETQRREVKADAISILLRDSITWWLTVRLGSAENLLRALAFSRAWRTRLLRFLHHLFLTQPRTTQELPDLKVRNSGTWPPDKLLSVAYLPQTPGNRAAMEASEMHPHLASALSLSCSPAPCQSSLGSTTAIGHLYWNTWYKSLFLGIPCEKRMDVPTTISPEETFMSSTAYFCRLDSLKFSYKQYCSISPNQSITFIPVSFLWSLEQLLLLTWADGLLLAFQGHEKEL